VTKSGEKLYGDFNRAYARREGLLSSRRFWIGSGVLLAVIVGVGVVVG